MFLSVSCKLININTICHSLILDVNQTLNYFFFKSIYLKSSNNFVPESLNEFAANGITPALKFEEFYLYIIFHTEIWCGN